MAQGDTNPYLTEDVVTADDLSGSFGYKDALADQAVLGGKPQTPFARGSFLNVSTQRANVFGRRVTIGQTTTTSTASEHSFNEYMGALNTMTPDELEDLQYRLYYSGAYDPTYYKEGRLPSGMLDGDTVKAYLDVLTVASREVGRNRSIADVLDQMSVDRADMVNAALTGGLDQSADDFPTQTVSVSDPAALSDLVEKVGKAVLGKKVTDAQKQKMIAAIQGSQVSEQTKSISASDANRQKGADVRDAAQTGASAPMAGEDIDKFMASIRKVESGGRYNARGPATKYGQATGAYQFLDSTWGGYGGFKHAADAPPEVQDERARQLMSTYFKQLGDWKLVAVAWHAGPGVALRMKRNGGMAGTRDANMSTDQYAANVIAGMGGPTQTTTIPGTPGLHGDATLTPLSVTTATSPSASGSSRAGSGTTTVNPTQVVTETQVDPQSRIEDMIRATNPTLAAAHDTVGKYGLFAKILGGG